MSCSCNCSPCNCQPRPSVCCTPTTESVEYTFENANLVGVGVFDNDTDNLVQFRGIVSDSAALTVTLDAGDNAIVLSFDQAALVADIPDADTTTRGILETATNAEAIAKAATNKILVPSNLAALGASDTFAGLVELATDAEALAGASTSVALTPANLLYVIDNSTFGMTVFADAVARGAAVPSFAGQVGSQQDSDVAFVAFGTNAGEWNPLFTFGGNFEVVSGTVTGINLNDDVTITSTSGNGDWNFGSGVNVNLDSCDLNFNSARLQISGVDIGDLYLLGTDNSGGSVLSKYLINTFLSSNNTQTGWGTPSSTLDRTTFATYAGQVISNPPTQAEVQAMDDALVIVSQHLGALITDLKARLLPAT